jgi:hypothetical protein
MTRKKKKGEKVDTRENRNSNICDMSIIDVKNMGKIEGGGKINACRRKKM